MGYPCFDGGQFRFQPFHSRQGVLWLDGKLLADGLGLVVGPAQIVQGSFAAQNLDADAFPELLAGQDLDQSHLSRAKHMGAAAGTAIRFREGDNADLARQLLFAAIVQCRQFSGRGIVDLHLPVGPDDLVGLAFGVQSLLPGDVGVVVDGHHVGTQVEAHVVAAVIRTEDAGDDVLSGVLLHVVEPPGPVDVPGNSLPNFHSSIAGVENDPVFFVDVRDGYLSQCPVVSRLPAALWIEGRAVQHHLKAVFPGLTGQNGS